MSNPIKTPLADYVDLLQRLGTFESNPTRNTKTTTTKLTQAQRAHILLRDKTKEWYASNYGCHPETVQRYWREDERRKRREEKRKIRLENYNKSSLF